MEKQIVAALQQISEKLDSHTEIFKEDSIILGGLKTGQEYLKAEVSKLRIQNARVFGELKKVNHNIFPHCKLL
jgi:hypothetical protein